MDAGVLEVSRYEPLIRKLGAACYRKLPRASVLDRDDLYQEGRMKLYKALQTYDPARQCRRRPKRGRADAALSSGVLTFATAVLTNRYKGILWWEWARARRASTVRDELTAELLIPNRYGRLVKAV